VFVNPRLPLAADYRYQHNESDHEDRSHMLYSLKIVFVIRRQDGTTETVITSPSSVAAIDNAVKTYSRALKNLAKK
jgi:hypothetical protein